MHTHAAAPAAERPVPAPERRSRGVVAGVFAGLAGVSAFVYVRNPFEATIFPPCPFHTITGGYCPGCGATRASYLVMDGDIAGAMHHNALWVIALPVVLWYLAAWASRNFLGRDLPRIRGGPKLGMAIVLVVLGFFVLRNLPFAFDALNPPDGA